VTGSLRILLALNFGNELLSGSYSLGKITLKNEQRSPSIGHAVAYDFNLNRIPVNYDITFTGVAYPAGDETPALSLKTPYPNPWQLSSSNEIRVPFDVPPSPLPPRFEVFDILGRKIKTPGASLYPTQWRWAPEADQLVPGLYFLRMETNEASYTTSFSVIR